MDALGQDQCGVPYPLSTEVPAPGPDSGVSRPGSAPGCRVGGGWIHLISPTRRSCRLVPAAFGPLPDTAVRRSSTSTVDSPPSRRARLRRVITASQAVKVHHGRLRPRSYACSGAVSLPARTTGGHGAPHAGHDRRDLPVSRQDTSQVVVGGSRSGSAVAQKGPPNRGYAERVGGGRVWACPSVPSPAWRG
jgi:hypothetical protein